MNYGMKAEILKLGQLSFTIATGKPMLAPFG